MRLVSAPGLTIAAAGRSFMHMVASSPLLSSVASMSSARPLPEDPVGRATIAVLAGSAKKAVHVSGVWVLGETDGADEDSPAKPIPLVAYRDQVERLVLGGGGSVVRPGVVHGRGAGIPAPPRAQAAQRGTGVYVTAGGAVPTWTFVHVDPQAPALSRRIGAARTRRPLGRRPARPGIVAGSYTRNSLMATRSLSADAFVLTVKALLHMFPVGTLPLRVPTCDEAGLTPATAGPAGRLF
ncbi:hypothetical protein ACTMTI_00325 [Nonomuraea sp. H19]|uniref:hypothetical protein n=1 Tax=Nonomuraea sp. H19 TaxID=3452206 RepID=UPI003F8948F1